ncbi:cytochrome P450 2F2-like [Brevipalpus obovatus]|uniref:cytochrome P450 2F2-like n=1 Tax=Brevipalpus obovatus TaxID=246614 RepID=UPI003D9F4A17
MSFLNSIFQIGDSNQVSKLLVSLIISLIAIQICKRLWEIFRLPPGPYGLPFVGYLPFIDENQSEHYTRLGEKYGSPFSIHLGKYDFVIINDWFHANEAFSKEELLARPPEGFAGGLLRGKGIVDLSGQAWKDQRRTALHLLRDIGLGKSVMEDKIMEEIETFANELDKHKDKPFNIAELLSASTSNNICVLTYGKRFDYDDKEKIELDNYTKGTSASVAFTGLATAMPFMIKIFKFFGSKKYKMFIDSALKSQEFDERQIKKHQDKEYEHISDYIDGFLEKIEERKAKRLPQETFNLPVLRANIGTLFAAGSTTVFSTMSWMILFLVKFPHYQTRIREEISQVIGTRSPSHEDRFSMPFTLAYIYETLRYRTNVPLNLPRFSTKDVYLGKHLIPQGTVVIINFYAIDHDPSLWTDPEKFYPERFLPEDQSKVVIPPYLTPFGGGKRKCMGESMALVELFQYITSIVQKYILVAHEGPENVSDEQKNGFVSFPAHMPPIVIRSAH